MPDGDIFSSAFFLLFWVVFMFFYPRLMLSQTLWKLEQTAAELEDMSRRARRIVLHEISRKPTRQQKETLNRFVEFFVIEPVSLDPYGLVKKIEHVINNEEERLRYNVRQMVPHADSEKQANLAMGVAGATEVHQIAKIVRHFVETIKETKNIQLAMVLQMQLPAVEKIARAMFKGTRSLARGEPIGDSVGPMIAAKMIGSAKTAEVEEDTLVARVKINGRNLIVMKARGPGGRLGKLGKAAEKIVSRERIGRIVTIDAAAKLEGEKTGSVAEGVGVAIGGPGVDRAYIENLAVKRNIPLDSIIIKMNQEEAITVMPREVKDAAANVMSAFHRVLERARPNERILVIGVGNTSGVGNNATEARKAEEFIDEHARRQAREKKLKGHKRILSKIRKGKKAEER